MEGVPVTVEPGDYIFCWSDLVPGWPLDVVVAMDAMDVVVAVAMVAVEAGQLELMIYPSNRAR
jgi:hypothetical protein